MPGDKILVRAPLEWTTIAYNGEAVAYSDYFNSDYYVIPSDVSSISISAHSTYNGETMSVFVSITIKT